MIILANCFLLYSKVFGFWETCRLRSFSTRHLQAPKNNPVTFHRSAGAQRLRRPAWKSAIPPCSFMMFRMGGAQKHSPGSTPPRRTTGRTTRGPRNRTAFTLNSPAYQVPFAIIPSSPIELGECGTKNQFISLFLFLELSLVSPASPTTIGLIPPQFENRVNMRRICHILVGLLVCAGLLRTVSGFIFDYLHPEYVSSFPSYLYFLRAVPFLITAGAVETILFVIKRRNK